MDGKLRNMASVYLTDEEGILFLYRIGSRVADKLFIGSAGGHFEKDELNDARACVLREMQEELGLTEQDIGHLMLRYVTLRLKNGEIRQNYYFFASVQNRISLESSEGMLQWVRYEDAASLEMPSSAQFMMDHYLKVGRYDSRLYAGVTREDGISFTVLEEF